EIVRYRIDEDDRYVRKRNWLPTHAALPLYKRRPLDRQQKRRFPERRRRARAMAPVPSVLKARTPELRGALGEPSSHFPRMISQQRLARFAELRPQARSLIASTLASKLLLQPRVLLGKRQLLRFLACLFGQP